MAAIEIRHNGHELVAFLNSWSRRQLPFAAAKALTRLAQEAQAEVRADLPKRFNIRSPWVPKGIRIVAARKSDWPKLEAQVGTRDQFMALQEEGGTKKPRTGKHLAFPTDNVRTGAHASIPRSKRPRRVIGTRRTFLGRISKGKNAGKLAVLRRAEPEGRYPLQVLYVFGTEARVPARFGFVDQVTHVVAKRYGAILERELEAALKSAHLPAAMPSRAHH